ncbi:hypothetical protein GGR57DRAFT_505265 [Xylariaceae sp. FL1272]|nr:hypothetical protein GGR57DRAFT_505265 [Xylariaceae sp. FL1272]
MALVLVLLSIGTPRFEVHGGTVRFAAAVVTLHVLSNSVFAVSLAALLTLVAKCHEALTTIGPAKSQWQQEQRSHILHALVLFQCQNWLDPRHILSLILPHLVQYQNAATRQDNKDNIVYDTKFGDFMRPELFSPGYDKTSQAQHTDFLSQVRDPKTGFIFTIRNTGQSH